MLANVSLETRTRADTTVSSLADLDRLLLERFGGKVGRGQAVESTRQRNLPDGWKVLFALGLTNLRKESQASDNAAEREDNRVSRETKGARWT